MTTTIEFTPAELEAALARNTALLHNLSTKDFLEHVDQLQAENTRLLAERKLAPVQGYSAGIPWAMHLRAYDAYCKKHGGQQALIEGWCRGGFCTEELDVFLPGWRDELSELTKLKAERDQLAEIVRGLTTADVITHLVLDNHHDFYVCECCGQEGRKLESVRHSEDCPYRLAREWAEAHK